MYNRVKYIINEGPCWVSNKKLGRALSGLLISLRIHLAFLKVNPQELRIDSPSLTNFTSNRVWGQSWYTRRCNHYING